MKSPHCSAGTHRLSKGLRTTPIRPRCMYPQMGRDTHATHWGPRIQPARLQGPTYLGTDWHGEKRRTGPGTTSERLCHLWGGNLHMRVQRCHLGSHLLPPRVHPSCHQTTEGAYAHLGKTTEDRLWTPAQRIRTPLYAKGGKLSERSTHDP